MNLDGQVLLAALSASCKGVPAASGQQLAISWPRTSARWRPRVRSMAGLR